MSTRRPPSAQEAVLAAFLGAILTISAACSGRVETPPLLVVSGPENFTSFQMRASSGEVIWQLEAETPSQLPFLVYPIVPKGFRQVFPDQGPPRPLRVGEALIMESRIPNRVFIHRALAKSEHSVSIVESEMHRTEPDA